MLQFGSFSSATVALVIGALIAWRVPHWLLRDAPTGQRTSCAGLVFDAALVGLVAARIGFVLRWWPDYLAAPLSLLAIGDGGFAPWLGLPVAIGFALWRTHAHSRRVLRRPLLLALAAGCCGWLTALGAFALLAGPPPALPDLALTTLDGAPASPMAQHGRPVVMNLWATWCPPCRREMPALTRVAASHPEVAFLLVNQGEDAAPVRDYLAREQIDSRHVLLDPQQRAMHATGARGLPTTLFFDANGRLVDSHVGELSAARIHSILRRHFGLTVTRSAQ
ncbi:MAG: TlpA family protein disulfide reductase [Dokdonella sp.]|nr:MAG: TlpA family protein disulfide reductase [Dokdonella sp.]